MEKQELFELLQRVIKWEIDAIDGIGHPVAIWPELIADTVLDYFDLEPISDAAYTFPPETPEPPEQP